MEVVVKENIMDMSKVKQQQQQRLRIMNKKDTKEKDYWANSSFVSGGEQQTKAQVMGVDKDMVELTEQKYKVDRRPEELGLDMTLGAGKEVNNLEIIPILKEPSYAEHVPEGGLVEHQVDQAGDQGVDVDDVDGGEPGAGHEGVDQGGVEVHEVQGAVHGGVGGVGQQTVPGRRVVLAGKRRRKGTTVSKDQSTILTYFSLHLATLGIDGELFKEKCNVGGPKRKNGDTQLEGPTIGCKRTRTEMD